VSDHRYEYVVIVERDGGDPLVAGFNDADEAARFIASVNMLTEDVWPDSFHNHARQIVVPRSPLQLMQKLVEEAVMQRERDQHRKETEWT
jgi:hypothetical protein